MSRTDLREKWYDPTDSNKDGKITFDELFPQVLKQMKNGGQIREPSLERSAKKNKNDSPSEFKEEKMAGGD